MKTKKNNQILFTTKKLEMRNDINNNYQQFKKHYIDSSENEISESCFNYHLDDSLNFKHFNDYNISSDRLDTESLTNIYKSNIKISRFNTALLKIINFNFPILKEKKHSKKSKIKKHENQINDINVKGSKKLGRKTERDAKDSENNGNIHDKFSDDNMRKKCKNLLIKYLRYFINKKIKSIYKGNLGIGDFKKELKIVKQGDKAKSTVGFDKAFLEKTLMDIFSQNISKRFSNFSLEHNKKIIINK